VILAVDVHYYGNRATVAGVMFEHCAAQRVRASYVSRVDQVGQYVPGQFYRRELPCILKLISEHRLTPATIIVDGYVDLDGRSRPGLGRYLYEALQHRVPVIGVAKKPFHGIADQFRLYRGDSDKPLFVTCAGLAIDEARRCVSAMHGKHRIPTLLRAVDRLSRNAKYE
jgi:deoxyribonuclease V